MRPEEFDELLRSTMRHYRSSQDVKERERTGERFDPSDMRLRHIAIAERYLEVALKAVRAEKS